jgi:hypothetical protein
MSAELILAPEAVTDLAEAYFWYEERKTGLGEDFLVCVEAAVESIRSAPARFALVDGECRRALFAGSHTPSSTLREIRRSGEADCPSEGPQTWDENDDRVVRRGGGSPRSRRDAVGRGASCPAC